MRFQKMHWIGIGAGLAIIILSLFFIGNKIFFFLAGIGILTAILPFVFYFVQENQIYNEKEEMFLEFARNLVESVKTGTPISKSIVNAKDRSYGVLSENIQKLANQISMGIPFSTAIKIFAQDVGNRTVSRAVTLIGQTEKAGGDIGEILESVAGAVSMSDKLKKERKAAISTLVVQGYIIFLVFIIIILVMQFKIIPMIPEIGGGNIGSMSVGSGGGVDAASFSQSFLYLLLIQGFFSGLIIGKLSEGNVRAGIKHSFILVVLSFVLSAGANLIWAV